MPIENFSRLAATLPASAAVTVTPDVAIVECDATSAGFTVMLYRIDDGAWHELIVRVVDADVSGNTVTITDGTFSTTLSAGGASVHLAMDYSGNWFIAGQYPVTSSAAAASSATSAGLAASAAQSAGVSAGVRDSTSASTATSQDTSQSSIISQGNSSVTSIVGSAGTSLSTNTSTTQSVATSQNGSQSLVLSVTTSTANSG